MPTLKEQQQILRDKQHLLAVWQVLHEYLDSTYVPKDGRPVEKGIKVPDCLDPIVNEDTIEEVLSQIGEGPIKELKKQVADIENMDVLIADTKG